MEKEYYDENTKEVDQYQASQQSEFANDIKRAENVIQHNNEVFMETLEGEEGRDYMVLPPGMEDPSMPSEKKLTQQLRREINRLKITDPEAAKEYEKYYFERNEIDEVLNGEPDLNEVKVYPGSHKGPYPEDDPEHYSQWFIEN